MISLDSVVVGSQARIPVQFTNLDGNPEDPVTVAFTLQAPDGTQTTPSPIVHDGPGAYHYLLTTAQSGLYLFRWSGGGSGSPVVQDLEGFQPVATSILVAPPPPSTIDLTTLDKAKEWMNITGSSGDRVLQRLITSMSAMLLNFMNRPTLKLTTTTEIRNGNGNNRMTLRYWPVVSVQSVSVNGVAFTHSPDGVLSGWVNDQYAVEIIGSPYWPSPGLSYSPTFVKGYQNVAIGYTYGFATVPFDIEQAVLDLIVYRNTIGRTKVGVKSEALTGIGTVSYLTDSMPDSVKAVVNQYKIRMTVQ